MPLVALAAAIVVMFARPADGAWWAGPALIGACAVAVGVVPWHTASGALGTLRDPLLFLAVAVPLAVSLDHLGVFEALAASVAGGRHLTLGLWVLAAVVTAVLNLDAAVVLLTPLYVRIAKLQALPPEALAFQPALLACLASHPLPVSNLTNLIVAEEAAVTSGDFLRHLGPATVVMVLVGWWGYRRTFDVTGGLPALPVDPDRAALRRGLPIVAFVVVGFVGGEHVHVPAWGVALVALGWSCAVGRSVRALRSVPAEAVALAAGLGVVVAGALPRLGLDRLLGERGVAGGGGVLGRLVALVVGAVTAAVTNNLPAVLATAPRAGPEQVWPLLLAVNAAPAFVLTGALSSLLWRDTLAGAGVEVRARRFSAIGVRVAGPAFLAGAAVVVFVP